MGSEKKYLSGKGKSRVSIVVGCSKEQKPTKYRW